MIILSKKENYLRFSSKQIGSTKHTDGVGMGRGKPGKL